MLFAVAQNLSPDAQQAVWMTANRRIFAGVRVPLTASPSVAQPASCRVHWWCTTLVSQKAPCGCPNECGRLVPKQQPEHQTCC